MKYTFSTHFYIKKDSRLNSKAAPIMMRITVNGKRAELSIKKSIAPEKWLTEAGKVKGHSADAKVINEHIANLTRKCYKIHNDLLEKGEQITAKRIRDLVEGKEKRVKTLLQVFEYHNKMIFELIGNGYSSGTFKQFETTKKHIQEFMLYQYKDDQISLDHVNYQFVTEFEFFMKTIKHCSHNSSLKYIHKLRKIINIALKNEWTVVDPFKKYESKLKDTKRIFLTSEELSRIETKELSMERMGHIRDVFVFCCYTGLSYADVQKLTKNHISKGIDGGYWVFTERKKTGTDSHVPLLGPALEIIKRYEHQPDVVYRNTLLPVNSNQKMNAYLKELAVLCEIDKNLTMHVARHTFATTITLTNDVPLETVQSMLGHKSIKTTQIYAKVVKSKVSADMMKLKSKLGGEDKSAVNQ